MNTHKPKLIGNSPSAPKRGETYVPVSFDIQLFDPPPGSTVGCLLTRSKIIGLRLLLDEAEKEMDKYEKGAAA